MTLTEKLGGIRTEFRFSSNDNPIEVESQFLVKRAKFDFSADSYSGYGYGVEGLYFEFAFSEEHVTEQTHSASIPPLPLQCKLSRLLD